MWTARRLGSVPHRGSDRRHPARGTGARARRRGVRAGVGRVAAVVHGPVRGPGVDVRLVRHVRGRSAARGRRGRPARVGRAPAGAGAAVARGGAPGVRAVHALGPRVGVRRRAGRRRHRRTAPGHGGRLRAGGPGAALGPLGGGRGRAPRRAGLAGPGVVRRGNARPHHPAGRLGRGAVPVAAGGARLRLRAAAPRAHRAAHLPSTAGARGCRLRGGVGRRACGGSWPRPRPPTSPPR